MKLITKPPSTRMRLTVCP